MSQKLAMDFHTHDLFAPPGAAIINLPFAWTLNPTAFSPRQGCMYSVGVHPWWTARVEDLPRLLDGVRQLLGHPQVVSLGECGLDALQGADDSTQEQVFMQQAAWAEELDKPVTLHVVRRFDRILFLHKKLNPSVRWTVHGFRGKAVLARQLLAAGLDLSFGPYRNEEAWLATPPERRHTETDADYKML